MQCSKARRGKASQNQDRDPFYGISKDDEGRILMFAERILQNKSK
jgi:hypothetical protein